MSRSASQPRETSAARVSNVARAYSRRSVPQMLWLIALACAVSACAGSAGAPGRPPASAPAPVIDSARIEITPPAEPLPVGAAVRAGSFARSKLNPAGVLYELESVLTDAKIFRSVVEGAYQSAGDLGPDVWEIELAASDYGAENAYTLELQILLLRDRKVIETYRTEQSARQREGVTAQLTIGPPELAELAERGVRELVRQLAADVDRLRAL
jgi:hypothetical protein